MDLESACGGAPCDLGTGYVLNEIVDFEVFAAEAYEIANIAFQFLI